jgi:hypothetical protein
VGGEKQVLRSRSVGCASLALPQDDNSISVLTVRLKPHPFKDNNLTADR